MNFREQLLAELSKRNTVYIASVIGKDKKLFKEIFELVLSNEEIISGRAAWVVEHVWLDYPYMIDPYINEMIDFLPISKYDNQKRHFAKILSTVDLTTIDEDRLGILIDRCFTWLEDPVYPTAVKMFSMRIIYNFIQIEPELATELIAIIENQFNDSTPGFKNSGEKILKELYKLTN
ncbi:MAG: hypothetical protein PF485_08600 [Bacteroidales bacterium]|jgi:hypothetical protein|nr:hypothetical protein [Bacteroidales bacterium]